MKADRIVVSFNDTITPLKQPAEFYKNEADTVQKAISTEIIKSETSKTVLAPAPEYKYILLKPITKFNNTPAFEDQFIIKQRLDSLLKLPVSETDSLLYQSNSLLIPLVYKGKAFSTVWDGQIDYKQLMYGKSTLNYPVKPVADESAEVFVQNLRKSVHDRISREELELFCATVDQLPDPKSFQQRYINRKPLTEINVVDRPKLDVRKIEVEQLKINYWRTRLNVLLQFTQNYISPNWYQGGNSNFAILSVLSGQANYDNQNNIQWENNLEWRTGFSSVIGDTLRKISTNDDLLRYLTKFGIKASGNWYYSASGDFSTQLFDNYKAINSNVFKARLFSPVRVNIGLGLDYKYKKLFSLMLAPVAYKYIYVNDTANVNPNLFGIKKGENHLSQIGSSLRAQLNYAPSPEWQVDSRLTFYTDYKKVEIDWEIINNFAINRFMSTRLVLNPRFDNTVYLNKGEKAKIQFKQLLSIGLSYRFL